MRVAFDVTVSARAVTGVGVYARHLYAALAARHVDLRLWQHEIGPQGRGLRRAVSGVRLLAWEGVGVGRRSAREDIDVVHATTSVGPRLLRRPFVLTVHDATLVTMPVRPGFSDQMFRRVFSLGAARQADAVLTPTQTAADAVAEHYGVPRSRIAVAPLGVSDIFRQVTPVHVDAARHRYALDRPYVLFVGADSPRKNLGTLVLAMGRLAAAAADLDLVIVGPSSSAGSVLDAAARAAGLRRPIRRLGEIPEACLPGVYGGASCLAYVSLCEGFGLPVVEAMAVGTPVVTSNCSAMPEVAAGAALLVNPTDPEAIADGIARVLFDTALADRLRAAGRIRSDTFTWSETASATEQVYRDVSGRADQRG